MGRTNVRKHVDGSSPYKGVSFCTWSGRWRASICVNYKVTNLGRFDTAYEAHLVYEAKAAELFGEFKRPAELY
jgi:hypothetical protein